MKKLTSLMMCGTLLLAGAALAQKPADPDTLQAVKPTPQEIKPVPTAGLPAAAPTVTPIGTVTPTPAASPTPTASPTPIGTPVPEPSPKK